MNNTPDNNTNIPAGNNKRSSPLLKVLPIAVLAAVLVYFAAQVYNYFADPMTITLVYEAQAEDVISMEGWLVRTEEPLPGQTGTVSRAVQEGQRVAAGETVATVYSDDSALQTVSRIETLELQLQQLQFALTSYLDPDAALKLDTSITGDILTLRQTLSAGDYAAAERAYRDLSALSEPGALRWLDLSLPQRTAAELAAALAQEGEIPPVPLTGGRASALNGAHDLSALTEAELAALAPRIDALPGCFGAGACLCAERRFLAGGDISMLLPPLLADMREVRRRFAPETELAASALLARVRLDAGRPAEARRSMETLRARLVSTGESRLLPIVDALTLQIDLRGAAAEAAARTYLRDSAPAGPIADVWQLGLYLTRAMAELALGRDADALETLAPLPAICEACHRRIDGVTASLLRAAALRRLGRPWEAEAAGALDKAEAQGLCRAVSALGAAVLPLLGDRRGALADAVREQTANFPSFLCAPAPAAAVPLTAAEKQVLRLLAEGRSNAEIAEALGVGLPTVKTHVSHILKKLGLSRRAEVRAAAGRFL